MRNVTHCACIYMGVYAHVVPVSILMRLYGCIFIFACMCVVPFLFWKAMNRVKELTDLSVLQLSGVVG